VKGLSARIVNIDELAEKTLQKVSPGIIAAVKPVHLENEHFFWWVLIGLFRVHHQQSGTIHERD
jgi:hypothetical protein